MIIKVIVHIFFMLYFVTLMSCGDNNPTPSVQLPSSNNLPEPGTLEMAQELWRQIKPLDFSKSDQAGLAFIIMRPTHQLSEAQKIPIFRELAKINENSMSILNKILQGDARSIDSFANFILAVIDDLPDTASKKAWLETSNGTIDLLSRLLTNAEVFHRTNSKKLIDRICEIAPTTKHVIENLWFGIKHLNFTKPRGTLNWDPNQLVIVREGFPLRLDVHLFDILMNLTMLPPSPVRRELSQNLVLRTGMAGTNSGLLQSLTQGPIDADIVKLCEVLFADQADDASRKKLATQKLGSLKEQALHYLIHRNTSLMTKLSATQLTEEAPHVQKLIALLIENGANRTGH